MRKRCIYCQTVSSVADDVDDCPACGMANKLTPYLATPSVHGARAFEPFISPATGKVIRTEAQYREDLKESNCVPYEPGIRQDQERKAAQQEREQAELVEKIVTEAAERADIS